MPNRDGRGIFFRDRRRLYAWYRLGPRGPVGSAVSGMAVANELARSVAEKPDDVQLQTAIADACTSPLTANSLIVVHVE